MAFKPMSFQEWIKALREHPEWREELRRFLLTEELLDLPDIVRELVEAQRRAEQRLEALTRAQRRIEQRVRALEEAQRRLEKRLDELARAQHRNNEAHARALATAHAQIDRALDVLKRLLRSAGQDERYSLSEALLFVPDDEADVVLPVKAGGDQTAWLVLESRSRYARLEFTDWSPRPRAEG